MDDHALRIRLDTLQSNDAALMKGIFKLEDQIEQFNDELQAMQGLPRPIEEVSYYMHRGEREEWTELTEEEWKDRVDMGWFPIVHGI